MVAPLSEVLKEGSSVFSLISLIKLHLASLPLASSYSHVAVSSVFCAQNIYFSAQTRGAPLNISFGCNQWPRFHIRQHIQKNANRVSRAACLELVQVQTQAITSQERNASLLWMPGGVYGDRERLSG